MAFKKKQKQTTVPRTPDQLFHDLPRRRHASLFDHQGQILRNYLDEAVEETDVAFQLPTGSGKTLVGLLLAEWRRRKFNEKVVYLCPTRQLVKQVASEALEKIGLTVEPYTGGSKHYTPAARSSYENISSVAVTTYSSLFNTNPFFRDADVIILDDVHTSENYIAKLWTLQVNRFVDEEATIFRSIAGVLRNVLDPMSFQRLTDDVQSVDDLMWVEKIPMPALAEVAEELRAVIDQNINDGPLSYGWSVIREHLNACQVYVSSSEILIRPMIPPTWTHPSFIAATQRVYMSATLGAGGDLERLTGRPKIHRLEIPQGWDRQGIGRRFFLFPEKSLEQDKVRELRIELMQHARRSLILTPSEQKAKEIAEDVELRLGYPVYSGSDLEERKSEFVSTDPAVAIIANRYDGIDLPEDECRVLFIEGLPQAVNLQERFIMRRMGAGLLYNERIQIRVLQAIGRCTRGLNDFSAVIVTGDDLPSYLTNTKRRAYFHPELQAELGFGVEESTDTDQDNLLENFCVFLDHGEEWEEANELILESRENATQKAFPAMVELAEAVRHEIRWQMKMWEGDYAAAYDAGREVLSKLDDPDLRGYRALWHYLTGCSARLAVLDGESQLAEPARIQFQKAKGASTGISWLIRLARVKGSVSEPQEDERAFLMAQVERLESYLENLGTLHNRTFSGREAEIRKGLQDGQDFERAHKMLGLHLGFEAGKVESSGSPDPWWHSGDVTFVFEDHANANSRSAISPTKARQAASHPDWIRENIPRISNDNILPVLISPVKRADQGAVPSLKKVSFWEIDEFRKWANSALDVVRDIRRHFPGSGDLVWRTEASKQLVEARIDAKGLFDWLSARSADEHLKNAK